MNMRFAIPLLLVLAIASSASAQQPPPAAGQKDSGFALEVHFGTQLVSLGGGVGSGTLGTLEGGAFAGAKLGRLVLGLGVAFSRVHQAMMGGADSSTTALVLLPGVRYAFVQSSDHRVELFGELDVGLGHTFTDPDRNNIVLRYIVGPGVRFWVHPQFAFAALTGIDGTFLWTNGPWSMNDVHAFFASVQLMGVL